jgi:adenine/guanine phosphoribosyltransferase-like PRPP-binding protein
MEKINKNKRKYINFLKKTFLDLRKEKEEDKHDSFKKTVSYLTERWKKNKRNLDIKNEWILEAVPIFESLIEKLYSEIKEHKYDIVIGDDTSGRIPALAIGGLMKLIYKKDKVKEPNLLFLAGHKEYDEYEGYDEYVMNKQLVLQKKKWIEKLKKYIDELKENNILKEDSHILLVTDYMARGVTVGNFASFFKKNNIKISVASLESYHSAECLNRQGWDFDICIGKTTDNHTPLLWAGRKYFEKNFKMFEKEYQNSDIFVRKPKDEILKANLKNIKNIRNDIKVLINYLFEYYNNINKE